MKLGVIEAHRSVAGSITLASQHRKRPFIVSQALETAQD